jgi:hypothetical protein
MKFLTDIICNKLVFYTKIGKERGNSYRKDEDICG